MKQSIILWIGSFVVIFLIGYLQRLTSPEYPISATVGVQGKEVTYSLDKISNGKNDYKIIISSETADLQGILQWKKLPDTLWNEEKLNNKNGILSSSIPNQKPFTKVAYRIKLFAGGKTYFVPTKKPVTLEFLGKVPTSIIVYFYLTLFGGLILAVRTGLESFQDNSRIKMYSIFTAIFFFVFAFAFTPIKRIYEAGTIGTIILPITYIFQWWSAALFLLWIAIMILVFSLKKNKFIPLYGAVITLIIFLMQNFI